MTIGLNTFGLYYQPKRLREIGYTEETLPDNLEALTELARQLDRVDEDGNVMRIGFLPNRIILMAALFGGGFKVLSDGSISIYTEENIRGLEYIVDAYKHYGFERVVHFRSSLNNGGLATEWPFVSGQYPIALDGQWRVEQLAHYAPDVEYRTALVPAPRGGTPGAGYVSVNLAFIPIGAKQPEGAMAFIRFWSGLERPDRAAKFLTNGGWLPMRRAIAEAPAYREFIEQNPQFQVFVNQLTSPNLLPLPAVPYQVFFFSQLQYTEDRAVRGITSAREALKDLERVVNQERARRERIEALRKNR
jgi:multiple sugar transport system substrate-binding protein